MKSLLSLVIALSFIATLSCQKEQATEYTQKQNNDEKILKIVHGRYYGECVDYCEFVLSVIKDSILHIKSGVNGKGEKLSDIITTDSLDQHSWDSLLLVITLDSIMKLDSIYGPLGSLDEGYTWIYLESNKRTKKVSFNEAKIPEELIELNKRLWKMRRKYE